MRIRGNQLSYYSTEELVKGISARLEYNDNDEY